MPSPAVPFPLARIGGLIGVLSLAVFPLFHDLTARDTGYGVRLVEVIFRTGAGTFWWLAVPVVCGIGLFVAAMVLPSRHRLLRRIGLAAAFATGALLFGIHRLALEQAIRPAWGIYTAIAMAVLVVVDGWLAVPRTESEAPRNSDAAVRALVAELERNPLRHVPAKAGSPN